MEHYKKAYAYLVGQIDEALTILDSGDLLQVNRVQDILQNALYEMEEYIMNAEDL